MQRNGKYESFSRASHDKFIEDQEHNGNEINISKTWDELDDCSRTTNIQQTEYYQLYLKNRLFHNTCYQE